MKNKKGLSDVIATVLIVLLALAAIAIVWGFVSPVLRNTGSSISASQKCLDAEVKPTACNSTSDIATLQYVGGDITKMIAIVQQADGATIVSETTVGSLLSTKVIGISGTSSGDKLKASAKVLLNTEGKEVTCNPFPVEIICVD